MRAFRWILAGALLSISSTLFASESNGITVSHFEPLERLSFQSNDVSGNAKISGVTSLSFDALGKTFDLRLEPNTRLFTTEARSSLPEGVQAYRGQLAGIADSWARIVVFNGQPSGLVFDGNQMFAIEAAGDSAVQSSSSVIYRLADTMIAPGSMSCGTTSLSGNGAATVQKLSGELSAVVSQGTGAVEEIRIGALGDYEFTNARGAQADAAIVTRLNNVDGIFSQEIGVQITVASVDTFTDIDDPFSDESEPGALLVELADYRQATQAQNTLGLTHLYTGRVLDGSTVGIAYGGALCQSRFGAGLSEGNSGATIDSLVAAHEIGHNFGAPHDGQAGSLCVEEPQTFIMAPSVNANNNTFSDCSKALMAGHVASASCVNPLPTVDMEISLNGQMTSTLLGRNETLIFDVSNNGLTDATNVEADITMPANLTLNSVAASEATCTNGAGTVNCVLDSVPGLSAQTIIVDAVASAVGADTIFSRISSDFDERPANNADSRELTVDPAVDLVIGATSAASISLDASTTISGTLENLSILDATGVTLNIALGTGLRADSASWSIGTCNVSAQAVDCQATNFDNLSNATVSVGVTGTRDGRFNYNATLSSIEPDADPANNNVIGEIRVKDPDSKGGGAIGLPFLLLIGLGALLARRRSTHP